MFLNAEVSKIFPLTNYMFQQKVQYKKHILKDKEKKLSHLTRENQEKIASIPNNVFINKLKPTP